MHQHCRSAPCVVGSGAVYAEVTWLFVAALRAASACLVAWLCSAHPAGINVHDSNLSKCHFDSITDVYCVTIMHTLCCCSSHTGCYKFTRYKSGKLDTASNSNSNEAGDQAAANGAVATDGSEGKPMLVPPKGSDMKAAMAMAEAFYWARDMINTPAEDFGPQHMKAEAEALARTHTGMALPQSSFASCPPDTFCCSSYACFVGW